MGLVPGNVVGVSIGGASAIAGLVLASRRNEPNKEPLIDVVVGVVSVHGDVATPMNVHDVPHFEDGPGHYTWNYGGPELLVRKTAVVKLPVAGADAGEPTAGTSDSASSPGDPAASGGAGQ